MREGDRSRGGPAAATTAFLALLDTGIKPAHAPGQGTDAGCVAVAAGNGGGGGTAVVAASCRSTRSRSPLLSPLCCALSEGWRILPAVTGLGKFSLPFGRRGSSISRKALHEHTSAAGDRGTAARARSPSPQAGGSVPRSAAPRHEAGPPPNRGLSTVTAGNFPETPVVQLKCFSPC